MKVNIRRTVLMSNAALNSTLGCSSRSHLNLMFAYNCFAFAVCQWKSRYSHTFFQNAVFYVTRASACLPLLIAILCNKNYIFVDVFSFASSNHFEWIDHGSDKKLSLFSISLYVILARKLCSNWTPDRK